MTKAWERVLRVSFLLILSAELALAQPQYAWRDRGDRFEGVAGEPVSGGNCDLVAVHYVPEGRAQEHFENLHLFFWLPVGQQVDIQVRQPTRVNYVMTPKRKAFPSGRQDFSWPASTVIQPLGLKAEGLHALVKNAAKNVYFPALLWTGDKPRPAGRYDFIFRSSAAFDFNATISREEQGRLTPVLTLADQSEDPGIFKIKWDGRDAEGKPAPEGLYALRLAGFLDTQTPQRHTTTVHFQHYGRAQ